MSAWTKEPWRVAEWRSHARASILSDAPHPPSVNGLPTLAVPICIAECSTSFGSEIDEANAARIVACVNACAGTTTEELAAASEAYGMPAMDALKGALILLTKGRDEALEALADVTRILEAMRYTVTLSPRQRERLDKAKEVVARLKS